MFVIELNGEIESSSRQFTLVRKKKKMSFSTSPTIDIKFHFKAHLDGVWKESLFTNQIESNQFWWFSCRSLQNYLVSVQLIRSSLWIFLMGLLMCVYRIAVWYFKISRLLFLYSMKYTNIRHLSAITKNAS